MPTNVEIKAKLKDFHKAIRISENLCGATAQLLTQEDTFFNVSTGRLKLRRFQDDSVAQLIHYSRSDIPGLKTSDYSICCIENHRQLLQVLESALGKRGCVKKTRHLFLYGQTRIHIDQVEGLGDFLEFEVVLNKNQDPKDGEEEAKKLMQIFEIAEGDLIKGAYIDLLLAK